MPLISLTPNLAFVRGSRPTTFQARTRRKNDYIPVNHAFSVAVCATSCYTRAISVKIRIFRNKHRQVRSSSSFARINLSQCRRSALSPFGECDDLDSPSELSNNLIMTLR